jgi:4-carboxymuconolactone decarboxylase
VHTYALGEIWSRDVLPRRERLLAAVACTAALGHSHALRRTAQVALRNGVTDRELDAVLGHVLAYAGAPCAIDADAVLGPIVRDAGGTWPAPDPAPKDDEQRRSDGYDVMQTLFGGRSASPDASAAWVERGAGELGLRAFEWAFGEVWVHGPLSRRDRSLIVLAIIATQPAEHELRLHTTGALNHGITREELEELLLTLSTLLGFPRTIAGVRVMREVFAERDARSAPTGDAR